MQALFSPAPFLHGGIDWFSDGLEGCEMNRAWNIWLAGGDMRQAKLAELLARDGHGVHAWALEESGLDSLENLKREETLSGLDRADCVVLPLPVLDQMGRLNAPLSNLPRQVEEVLDAAGKESVLCGGMVNETLTALAQARGLNIHDYFAREELAVANSVPTVEGAIQIAMENMPITLCGARVLVVGCGRIGKLLAVRMSALGAKVTVAARKYEQLAWAEAYGFHSEHIYQWLGYLCGYDLVVNTVPHQVLGVEELADLKEGCLVIDLASKPGGVDMDAAAQLGVQVIWALSLPGKVAPVTAGAGIRTAIYNLMRELGA